MTPCSAVPARDNEETGSTPRGTLLRIEAVRVHKIIEENIAAEMSFTVYGFTVLRFYGFTVLRFYGMMFAGLAGRGSWSACCIPPLLAHAHATLFAYILAHATLTFLAWRVHILFDRTIMASSRHQPRTFAVKQVHVQRVSSWRRRSIIPSESFCCRQLS